jgi:hypothetical protein
MFWKVGVGTTSPVSTLTVNGIGAFGVNSGSADVSAGRELYIRGASNSSLISFQTSSTGSNGFLVGQIADQARIQTVDAHPLTFHTSNVERARIDSSGRLLVGTSTAFSTSSNALIQAVNTSGGEIVIGRDFALGSGSTIGRLAFFTKPSAVAEAARIEAVADALHSGGAPTRLVFSTTADGASSPTERMRITSDAYVRLASGSGGIQFNGDTAAANALDDYEEGTWTPALLDHLGGTAVMTSGATGSYTKIGNQVTLSFSVMTWSSKGTMTGFLKLGGIPFPNKSGNSRVIAGFGTASVGSFTNVNRFIGLLEANQTRLDIFSVNSTTNESTDYAVSNVATAGNLYGLIMTYFI